MNDDASIFVQMLARQEVTGKAALIGAWLEKNSTVALFSYL